MKLQVFTQPCVPPPEPPQAHISPGFPVPGPVWPGWPVMPEHRANPLRPRERHEYPPWPIED